MKYSFTAFLLLITVLLSLNFSTFGLQDWWPQLVTNMKNFELYRDIHYYTGPLYPILLAVISKVLPIIFVNKILGLILIFLYSILLYVYVNIYFKSIRIYGNITLISLFFAFIFLFLGISRYVTIYQIPDDYHTLTLILYLLIIINQINIENFRGEDFPKIVRIVKKIPVEIFIALILLNRTHEGLLLLLIWFPYTITHKYFELGKLSIEVIKRCFVKYFYTVIISLGIVWILISLLSLFNVTPDFLSVTHYIFVEAPKSKNGVDFSTLHFLLSNIAKTIADLRFNRVAIALISLTVFFYILEKPFLLKSIKARWSFIIKKIISYKGEIIIFSLAIAFIKRHLGGSLNELTLLLIIANFIVFVSIIRSQSVKLHKYDATFIIPLSLIASHFLSTGGIINEPFIVFLLLPFLYNIVELKQGIVINKVQAILINIAVIIIVFNLVSVKFLSPRSWWLYREPSLLSDRTLMVGKEFSEKYMYLKQAPVYANDKLLNVSDELCSNIKGKNNLTIFSYPVPFYNYVCKQDIVPIDSDVSFSLWYDVAPEFVLEREKRKLQEKKPDFIVILENSSSLFSSSKYYSKNGFDKYYHTLFLNYMNRYIQENLYDLKYKYYLIDGIPISDPKQLLILKKLDEEKCFQPNHFEICKKNMEIQLDTPDITVVSLFSKRKDVNETH